MCGRDQEDDQCEVAVVVLDPEDEQEMPPYRFSNQCRCDPRTCPCPIPVNPNPRCHYNAGQIQGPCPPPLPPPPPPPPAADPNFQYYGNGRYKRSPSPPPPPPPPGDPDHQFYGGQGPPSPPPQPPPGEEPGRPYGNGSRRPTPSPPPPPGPPPPPPPGDPNPHFYGGNGGGGGQKPMPSPPPSPPPMNQKPSFSSPPYPYPPPPPRRNRPARPRPTSTGGGQSHLFALAATLILFLIGLIALILYLIYRTSSPSFSLTSASIFLLNTTNPHPTTTSTTCFIATTMQFTILAKNPSKHASIHYNNLVATLTYCDGEVIAPPAKLPPLHQGKRSTVAATVVVGSGGEAVPVAPGLIQAMVADVRRGVMGLRLVVEGRARYKLVGGVIKSGHYGVSVKCDLLVGVGGFAQRGIYGGQVPLVGDPKCTVDI